MSENPRSYVHGRSNRESTRLHDQASGLGSLLHEGTRYPPGSRILEAGCGVGAQTLLLAGNSPGAHFVSIDISPESLARAQERISGEGLPTITFLQADICNLPFPVGTFDHVFLCFTLEHIPDPLLALGNLKKVLRLETLTTIEGDHGSAIFYPDTRQPTTSLTALLRFSGRQEEMHSLAGSSGTCWQTRGLWM